MSGEITAKVTRTLTVGALTVGGNEQSILTDYVLNLQKTVPANSTDVEFGITIDVSEVKAMALIADQACTVKTNSTSSPGNTITLVANNPLVWTSSDPSSLAFLTVDVTKFFVTTTSATILKFAAAIDSTPGIA